MTKYIVFAVLYIFSSTSTTAQSSKKDFKQLMRLFEGRYKTAVVDGTPTEKQLLDQMTITIKRIDGSYLGKNTFYVKYVRGNGSLYRQRLYTFTFTDNKIQSQSVAFQKDSLFVDVFNSPEKVKNLSQTDMKAGIGCPDNWAKTSDGFIGSMDSCAFKSERRGGKEIYIFSRMKVSKQGMATTEAGKDETGKVLFGKLEDYALKLQRL